jgi:hypothetical protein
VPAKPGSSAPLRPSSRALFPFSRQHNLGVLLTGWGRPRSPNIKIREIF